MPKCSWRDRPGDEEMCKFLAGPGETMCPRHKFLDELKQQEKDRKEGERARAVGTRAMVPNTREGLLRHGLQFKGSGNCRECNQQIEWWVTLKGNNSPYNRMPELQSPAVSHFATCPKAAQFRRAS